ncbi:hypothetical protein ACX27_11675 [Nostoc piscinale CENA21]|uniref:Restriction endonuclease, type I, EcoRI, R subunit/Type III n=1 Tax=Nostoc piscinale CENA21 TaxID=224013 RepID=A0A0M4TW63_9NOSO|nr:hypothetical protein [Nostoc piscinale]ALF53351.1 hypothetical protein ACX27_11675 [Nostoc piscinale CENA21]
MSYSQFSLPRVIQDFNLTLVEGGSFLPLMETDVTAPPYLLEFLQRHLQLAIALNTEKARSELIICPLLLAVKEALQNQISLFSGEDFNVDAEAGLTGVCDFILSLSPEQLFVKAPVAVVVEAKKEDLKGGLGQCVAEMVAAWKFNQAANNTINTIYGTVTTGTVWRFLRLQDSTITIDLTEYPLPPIEPILRRLVYMVSCP